MHRPPLRQTCAAVSPRRKMGMILRAVTLAGLLVRHEVMAAEPAAAVYVKEARNLPLTNGLSGAVRPFQAFRLVAEFNNGYVVAVSNASVGPTLGFLPRRDRMGNATANVSGEELTIRSAVVASIGPGFLPLQTGAAYEVVAELDAGYAVRYDLGSFALTALVPRTACTFLTPRDRQLRAERDRRVQEARTQSNALVVAQRKQEEIKAKKALSWFAGDGEFVSKPIPVEVVWTAPESAADRGTATTSLAGAWDVVSERSGGAPVQPRIHLTWHVSGDTLLITGTRALRFQAGEPKGGAGSFRLVNRVGAREVVVYSCLYELLPGAREMRVALNAGDAPPPGFTEDPNSWHFVLLLRRR